MTQGERLIRGKHVRKPDYPVGQPATHAQPYTDAKKQRKIIDESERLSATDLELLRDRYDRDNVALILILNIGSDQRA